MLSNQSNHAAYTTEITQVIALVWELAMKGPQNVLWSCIITKGEAYTVHLQCLTKQMTDSCRTLLLLAITELNKKEQNVSHMVKVHVKCTLTLLSGSVTLDNGSHKLGEISNRARKSDISMVQRKKKVQEKTWTEPKWSTDSHEWKLPDSMWVLVQVDTNLNLQPRTIRASWFPSALMGAMKLDVELQQLTPTTSVWMQTGIVWHSWFWSDLEIFLYLSSPPWQWAARLYSS